MSEETIIRVSDAAAKDTLVNAKKIPKPSGPMSQNASTGPNLSPR